MNRRGTSAGRPAGRQAMMHYENEKVRWTFWGKIARFFGIGVVSRYADKRVEKAERTWGEGARAEVVVGDKLEHLRERGFELFHDLRVQGIGNIDHVAIGPQGIFAIETKSHRGLVSVTGSEVRPVLLLRGRPPAKNFVEQTWRGAQALSELLAEKRWFSPRRPQVFPVLCFSRAWLEEGSFTIKGVHVTKMSWLARALSGGRPRLSPGDVRKYSDRLRKKTGRYAG